ncbi:MAG: HAD-IA family hydrolase [Candidatus Dojkabacteria bacterium]
MKYKAVLFDLDDTLTKSNKVYNKAMRVASDFLAEKFALDPEVFYSLALEKYTIVAKNFPTIHTRHSRILLFRLALDEMAEKYDLSLLPDAEDLYWNYFMESIELYPGVIDTLKQINDAGIKIAIVSDGSLSLRIRKTKAAGLLPYVDEIVASEEVIFEKPFSAIFTLALNKLDINAEDAIMVGNNMKNDIRGAQLVGIKAGLFDPEVDGNVEGREDSIKPDFTLKTMPELLVQLGLSN